MSKKFLSILLAIMIVAIALVVWNQLNIKSATGQKGVDLYKDEIAFWEDTLKNPKLDSEGREIAEKKLQTVQYEATQFAEGLKNPAPRGKISFPPKATSPNDTSRAPDGIDNAPPVPRPLPSFNDSHITNSWRKTVIGRMYLVYAGSLENDKKQGMVLVFQPDTVTFNRYLTPIKKGDVKVISETWPYITLQAQEGDMFYFDPVGERFVDSLDAPTIVPVDETPIPKGFSTPTPNPYP